MAETSEAEKAATKIQSDNLSQLVARIFNQLALSAWLPSAFLVLAATFVIVLGQYVGMPGMHPFEEITAALRALGDTKFTALVLMLVAIVVLTMLTQAFSFEAIRFLEGYWGESAMMLAFAQQRCVHYGQTRQALDADLASLKVQVWPLVDLKIRDEQREYGDRGQDPELTDAMILRLRYAVTGEDIGPDITAQEQAVVDGYDWVPYAPQAERRRMEILEHRRQDYPQADEAQPTRLGNILRHYESLTSASTVETMVEEVFDDLPFSLQIAHDEQRGRLDLYCSMIFVWVALVALALIRFNWHHWGYSVGALGLGALGVVLTYRASLSSARHYGSLLLQIDEKHIALENAADASDPGVSDARGLGLVPAVRRANRYLTH